MIRVSLAIAATALLTACSTPMDHRKMNSSDHGAMAGCSMATSAGADHHAAMGGMTGMGAMAGKADGGMMMCGKPGEGSAGGCTMAQGATGEKSMSCCCSMMKHKS